jgi:hypothetical protein
MKKYKWKVDPPETGRYRSFHKRGWPSAEYEDGTCAAKIYCEKGYYPCDARVGNHPELKIRVADHSVTPWQWRTLKKRAKTLAEAKIIVSLFFRMNPHYILKD